MHLMLPHHGELINQEVLLARAKRLVLPSSSKLKSVPLYDDG
jgi:hypothetical protein